MECLGLALSKFCGHELNTRICLRSAETVPEPSHPSRSRLSPPVPERARGAIHGGIVGVPLSHPLTWGPNTTPSSVTGPNDLPHLHLDLSGLQCTTRSSETLRNPWTTQGSEPVRRVCGVHSRQTWPGWFGVRRCLGR